MSKQAYPEYKPSGVEWLGAIPAHWDMVRFKYVLWLQRGHDLPVTEFQEGEYPVCGSNGCIGYHSQYTTKGPGVTVGRSGSVGEVNYVNTDYWAHNTALYVKEFRRATPRYSFYLLKTLDVKYLSEGTAVGTLNRNYIHDLPIAISVVAEQHDISAFLDRETERIDALIEKKQRQIELLQEKRIVLISHAVTKGLDPKAKIKNSGIEWLGEIPEHWGAIRFKFALAEPLKYGANESAEYDDATWPRYVRITDVDENGTLRKETFKSLPEDVARPYLLKEGDLLFARSGATVGKTFLYLESWGRAAYAGYLIRARLKKSDILPTFAAYFCRSYNYWDWLRISFIQATIQNVSAERYANMVVPMPPINEQSEIVKQLETKTSVLDRMAEKVSRSIETLREYRNAIITAAVTGKIDVRKEVA